MRLCARSAIVFKVTVVGNPINTVQLQHFVLCNLIHVLKAPGHENILTSVLDRAGTSFSPRLLCVREKNSRCQLDRRLS
jgi:hypothetical protein